MAKAESARRILLTGASRGLGLEFTGQWLAAGHRLFALARAPEKSLGLQALSGLHPGMLTTVPCDVAAEESVDSARRAVEGSSEALDLVLNNAATFGREEQNLEALDWDEIRRVLEVNTVGPLRISRAFLPLLKRGRRPRLIHLTSLMGSMEDNRSGGHWSYRMSKAALNMANRNLALELAPLGILSAVLSPGWVRTEMGGSGAPLSPAESVSAMVATIDALKMEQSGGFFDRHGKPQPW